MGEDRKSKERQKINKKKRKSLITNWWFPSPGTCQTCHSSESSLSFLSPHSPLLLPPPLYFSHTHSFSLSPAPPIHPLFLPLLAGRHPNSAAIYATGKTGTHMSKLKSQTEAKSQQEQTGQKVMPCYLRLAQSQAATYPCSCFDQPVEHSQSI